MFFGSQRRSAQLHGRLHVQHQPQITGRVQVKFAHEQIVAVGADPPMDPTERIAGMIGAHAGGIDGRLSRPLAGVGAPTALPGRQGDRQCAVNGGVNDDFAGSAVSARGRKDAKGVAGAQRPRPQGKLPAPRANGRLSPVDVAAGAKALYDGHVVAGHVGLVHDFYPKRRDGAAVDQFKLFAKPVTDGYPSKAQPPAGVKSMDQDAGPAIGYQEHAAKANQEGIPDAVRQENGRYQQNSQPHQRQAPAHFQHHVVRFRSLWRRLAGRRLAGSGNHGLDCATNGPK